MLTVKHASIRGTTTLLALLMTGAAVTAVAQTPARSPNAPQHRAGKKATPAMSVMMKSPHHMLVTAHHSALGRFAEALHGHATQATTVDLDLARPAVAEMRHNFNEMRAHHQAQAAMMSNHSDSTMSAMKRHMETHLATLSTHLTALESEVAAPAPAPKRVAEHTTEILKRHAGMAMAPAAGARHRM